MNVRRGLDLAAASLGLLFTAPLLVLIAAGIALLDERPVLFRQVRSGRQGKLMTIVKFRTMRAATSGAGGPLPDEARTTPFGRFLRRTRLDELPQLWNLLIGDMSLVGPRPLLPATIAEVGEAGRLRGSIRPGLTGLAQVSGNTLLSTEEKIALDNWYIAHRSLSLDVAIIVRTLRVSLLGERRDLRLLERAHARSPDRRG